MWPFSGAPPFFALPREQGGFSHFVPAPASLPLREFPCGKTDGRQLDGRQTCWTDAAETDGWTDGQHDGQHNGNDGVRAHKIVLAAGSPVLRAMFASAAFRESTAAAVSLQVPAAAHLRLAVDFLYGCRVSVTNTNALDLLKVATTYDIASLREGDRSRRGPHASHLARRSAGAAAVDFRSVRARAVEARWIAARRE